MKAETKTANQRNGTSPRPRKAKASHSVRGGTSEANRLAVVILEVLAGQRTPTEAAALLEVSLPRYYQLETRAVEGLVAALEPRPLGKQPSLQTRIDKLQKQLDEAQRQTARQQALLRAAQRSLGLKPPAADNAKMAEKASPRRRKRRPTVRALKAADALKKNLRSLPSQPLKQQAEHSNEQPPPAANQAPLLKEPQRPLEGTPR
jgi:hypothetical protein